MKVQKKGFETGLEWIYLDNVKILQNKKFNLELKKEEIDEGYLREVMGGFVRTAVQEMDLEAEHTSFLKAVYMLSLIMDHGGIELFFEKKITPIPVDLGEQPLFIKIHRDMGIREMLSELEKHKATEPAPGT